MKRSTRNFLIKVIGIIAIYLVFSWIWNYKFLGLMP